MIELEHIYLSYTKEFYTLEDVSLHIKKGENVVLYGLDESGKSSLIRILAGLETPTEGTYFLKGHKVKKIDAKNDISIGYMSSKGIFFEKKTVRQNLEYVLKIRKVPKDIRAKKVDVTILQYGLDEIKDKKICELSNFERVKVEIARLSLRPVELFLIDCDFNAFNEKEQKVLVKDIMSLIKTNNATSVIATNDDKLINVLGNRYIKMEYGVAINE